MFIYLLFLGGAGGWGLQLCELGNVSDLWGRDVASKSPNRLLSPSPTGEALILISGAQNPKP